MSLFRMHSLLPLLMVGVLVLAACGGDDDDAGDAATATPTTAVEEEDGDEGGAEEVHWGYEGEAGPAEWASLSAEFETCEAGVQQSPIDIETENAAAADIPDPVLNWQTGDLELSNNGHTIQADVARGSTSELNGQTYNLIQFHWHRPSEHTVDGDPFAMELHFVHANDANDLAVLGVLIDEGESNPLYDILWDAQPEEGETATVSDVDFSQLLPDDLGTYIYAGSLTTPACSEGVAWNVLEVPASMSAEQVGEFLYEGNARPVQPLNDRTVEADED